MQKDQQIYFMLYDTVYILLYALANILLLGMYFFFVDDTTLSQSRQCIQTMGRWFEGFFPLNFTQIHMIHFFVAFVLAFSTLPCIYSKILRPKCWKLNLNKFKLILVAIYVIFFIINSFLSLGRSPRTDRPKEFGHKFLDDVSWQVVGKINNIKNN